MIPAGFQWTYATDDGWTVFRVSTKRLSAPDQGGCACAVCKCIWVGFDNEEQALEQLRHHQLTVRH